MICHADGDGTGAVKPLPAHLKNRKSSVVTQILIPDEDELSKTRGSSGSRPSNAGSFQESKAVSEIKHVSRKGSAWTMTKAINLSQPIFSTSDLDPADEDQAQLSHTMPSFQAEWEEEFQETSFEPYDAVLVLILSTLYCCSQLIDTILDSTDKSVLNGPSIWAVLALLPPTLCSAISVASIVLLLLDCVRPWCRRHYNTLCVIAILLLYVAVVLPPAAIEASRSTPANSGAGWSIDFSTFPPHRTCNDSNPVASFEHPAAGTARVGCNSVLLSGSLCAACVLCNLLPRVCRTAPTHAAAVALLSALVLLGAAVTVGVLEWGLVSAVAIQLGAGLGAALLCRLQCAAAREEFAAMKGTLFAAEQSRGLLHTLIPRDVLRCLAARDSAAARGGSGGGSGGGGGLLVGDVRECTVMFCSLEPQAGPHAQRRENQPAENAGN